jgi:hypothetical protein
MLPMLREEFFDSFLLKVLLHNDGVLNEFSINLLEFELFFFLLFLEKLRLLGFEFISIC